MGYLTSINLKGMIMEEVFDESKGFQIDIVNDVLVNMPKLTTLDIAWTDLKKIRDYESGLSKIEELNFDYGAIGLNGWDDVNDSNDSQDSESDDLLIKLEKNDFKVRIFKFRFRIGILLSFKSYLKKLLD